MTIRRPPRPPVGIVPVDLIPRSVFPRRVGRPRHIPHDTTPTSTPSRKRAPSTPSSRSSGYERSPTKRPSDYGDESISRNTSPTPSPSNRTLSSKRSKVDLSDRYAGKRIRASEDLTRLVNSDEKLAGWSQTVYHRNGERHLIGDLAFHRSRPKRTILDVPLEPTVVEGITMRKGFLRAMDDNLAENDEYETRELPVAHLIRFMDQQPHDYTLDSHTLSSRATILFEDGPGIRPADIRARRLRVSVFKPETLKSSPDRILWRVVYYCNNLCRNIIPGFQAMPALDTEDRLEEQLLALATEGKKRFLQRQNRSYTADSIETPSGRIKQSSNSASGHPESDAGHDRSRASRSLDVPALHPHLFSQMQDPFPSAGGADDAGSEESEESSDEEESSPASVASGAWLRRETPSDRSLSYDGESQADDVRSSSRSGSEAPAKPRRRADHCHTRLVIEMTVNQSGSDLCTAYVRKRAYHPPAVQRDDLRSSPFLRRALHEAASVFGMTPMALRQFENNTLLHTPHAEWLAVHCSHRLPKNRDHEQAVITAQKASRLDKNPLTGIEIIERRHPEVFLHCDVPKCLDDDWDGHLDSNTRLECVVASQHSILTGLLQSFRMGIYMDSSWRNKNAFRCPLTFLLTADQYQSGVPLCAMVSKHADARAYTTMLEKYRDAVHKLARQIVNGEVNIDLPGVPLDRIESVARVVVEDGWWPSFAMIDGDDAERNALENVFPDMPIRACQFHVMQACRSKARKVFGRYDDFELLTKGFLEAVRRCQRCPDEAEWPRFFADFEEEVRNLVPDDEGDSWELLRDYMEDEWFSDRWRPYVVDYGQQSNVTRDGPGSTNNFVEKMFRTFDAVFLGCRANKRLDRLLTIIITQFFPFYEMLARERSRPSPDLVAALFNGAHRWEIDRIHPCSLEAVHPTQRQRFHEEVFAVYPPPPESGKRKKKQVPHFCGLDRYRRETCTCTYQEQTGKRCLHIWAMIQYNLVGSVRSYAHEGGLLHREYTKAQIVDEEATVSLSEDFYDHRAFWKLGENEPLFEIDMDLFDVPPIKFDAATAMQSSAQRGEPLASQTSPSQNTSPSKAQGHSGSRRRDISPIGRRYQDQRTHIRKGLDDLPAQPSSRPREPHTGSPSPGSTVRSEDSSESILQWNRNASGRPANVQPKDPYRKSYGKSAPSTLSKQATKKIDELNRPTGLLNTGYDCYALSMFQILLRQPLIRQELEKGYDGASGLKAVLGAVRDAMFGSKPVSLPGLRDELYELYLIDDPNRMDDPLQLFSSVMNHVAAPGEFENPLSYFFEFSIESRVDCPACGDPFLVNNESHSSLHTLLIRPQPLSRTGVTPLEDLIVAGMQMGTSRTHRCPKITCDTEVVSQSRSTLTSDAPFFNVQIAWDLFDSDNRDDSTFYASRLRIPLILKFDDHHLLETSQPPADPTIRRFTLAGIICKIGATIEGGHYIAIVRHMGAWWVIDDQHVSYCTNPAVQAFARGRFPVMLFYSRYEEPAFKSHWESIKGRRRSAARQEEVQRDSRSSTRHRDAIGDPGDIPQSGAREMSPQNIDLVEHPIASSYAARQRVNPPPTPVAPEVVSANPDLEPNAATIQEILEAEAALMEYMTQVCPEPVNLEDDPSSPVVSDTQRFFPDWIDTSVWSDSPGTSQSGAALHDASKAEQGQQAADVKKTPSNVAMRRFGSNTVFDHATPSATADPARTSPTDLRRGPLPHKPDRFSEWLSSRDNDIDPSVAGESNSRPPSSYGPHTPLRRIESVYTSSPIPSIDPRFTDMGNRMSSAAIAAQLARLKQLAAERAAPPPVPKPSTKVQPSKELYGRVASPKQILARLRHVPFGSGSPHGPLTPIKAYHKGIPRLSGRFFRQTAAQIRPNRLQVIPHPERRICLSMSDFIGMEKRSEWWNNFIVDAAVLASTSSASEHVSRYSPPVEVTYVRDLIAWDMISQRPNLYTDVGESCPWPELGQSSSWRRRTTVSVINVKWATHFATVAVFGPQRLVIVFDALGGKFDDPALKKAWTSLLQSRLDYELRRKMVDATDNQGWIFAPNTEAVRDAIGWCVQSDGCHCGPIASAAAYLILWNIRPHYATLGSPTPFYGQGPAEVLRDWFLVQILRVSHHTRHIRLESRHNAEPIPWWEGGGLDEIEAFIARFGAKAMTLSATVMPPAPLTGPVDFEAMEAIIRTAPSVEPRAKATKIYLKDPHTADNRPLNSIEAPSHVDSASSLPDASLPPTRYPASQGLSSGSPVKSPRARLLLHSNTLGLSVASPKSTTSPSSSERRLNACAQNTQWPGSGAPNIAKPAFQGAGDDPATLKTRVVVLPAATPSAAAPKKKIFPILNLPGPTPVDSTSPEPTVVEPPRIEPTVLQNGDRRNGDMMTQERAALARMHARHNESTQRSSVGPTWVTQADSEGTSARGSSGIASSTVTIEHDNRSDSAGRVPGGREIQETTTAAGVDEQHKDAYDQWVAIRSKYLPKAGMD